MTMVLWRWAISEMRSTSVTLALGLPKVSMMMALVLSRNAFSTASKSAGSTMVVSTPCVERGVFDEMRMTSTKWLVSLALSHLPLSNSHIKCNETQSTTKSLSIAVGECGNMPT